MKTQLEDFLNKLEGLIKNAEKALREMKEEFPEREIESFYDYGLEDGCPINVGNYNDVYDDGHSNGYKDGELGTLNLIYDELKAIIAKDIE